MVARDLIGGRAIRVSADQLGHEPPFPIDAGALFVAYYASAELGCFRVLGWPMPARILDLCAEFKCLTSGKRIAGGRGLLGALTFFGLDGIGATEKADMRELAIRGGPFTDAEITALIDYCETDVDALARLLPAMLPGIDLPRALLRGRYMAAAAAMEHAGVPVDTEALALLRENWVGIQDRLIADVDADYGVYDGRTFKANQWAAWLERSGIAWPRLESGRLALDDDTFRDMARSHLRVSPIRELRHALSDLRLSDLAVGGDGRNRVLLGAFGSRTGRNQPSNSKFIFGPSTWLRGLIKPPPGCGVAYVDWSTQEFAIAAVMSGDQAMIEAYQSGDPYLAFGKQAGLLPGDATKQSHSDTRHLLKTCVLGVGYGNTPSRRGSTVLRPSPAIFCAHTARLIRSSGSGRITTSITRCSWADCILCSVGRFMLMPTRIRARCGISRCRRTERR
jgi:hypothetical protein